MLGLGVKIGIKNPHTISAPPGGGILLAGTWGGGMFKSVDNGSLWIPKNTGLMAGDPLYSYYVSASRLVGNNIFIGTALGEVYISSDDGESWTSISTGLPKGWAAITFIITLGSDLFCGVTGYGIYISTDNGAHWTQTVEGLSDYSVLSATVSGSNIFIGMSGSKKIFLSTNHGASWTDVTNDSPALHAVNALANFNGRIFAGYDYEGIYYSDNNGTTWIESNSGLSALSLNIKRLLIIGSNVIAGADTYVNLSINNGATWTPSVLPSENPPDVSGLAVLGSNIFASGSGGSATGGVFVSQDNNDSWTKIVVGLSTKDVRTLLAK